MAGPSLTPSSSGVWNPPSGAYEDLFLLEGESSRGMRPPSLYDAAAEAEALAAAAEADAAIEKLNVLIGPQRLPETLFGREVRDETDS